MSPIMKLQIKYDLSCEQGVHTVQVFLIYVRAAKFIPQKLSELLDFASQLGYNMYINTNQGESMIDIKKILEKEPTLTPFGIEGPRTYHSKDPNFYPDDIEQIETCIEWLKRREISKRINYATGSYGIKHIVEKEFNTYVSNGCFIAAVIHLGIPYSTSKRTKPNIYVAISTKEIRKYLEEEKRVWPRTRS